MKYAYDIDHKRAQLKKFMHVIESRLDEIEMALANDLGKPKFEARVSETGYVIGELKLFISQMKSWAKTKKVRSSLLNFPSSDRIMQVPYGKVLVFAPWNYPFNLSLAPAIAAYAAGNSVVIKPSELAPETASVINDLVASVFTSEEIQVINGGADVAQNLLSKKWDYIFFTGGTGIGKKIAAEAAKTLTPVTLELGGKNPCLIDTDCNLELAAKRIVWGKFFNAGQTCIAPDFVLVPDADKPKFLQLLKAEITKCYGGDAFQSPDLARVVNTHHFDRLTALIQPEILSYGGKYNRESLFIEPTILDLETASGEIMEEEIFGPILPVIGYKNQQERDEILSRLTHSLAFYVFSNDKEKARELIAKQPCGGACLNDTVVHFANARLPFGGTGNSGYGAYHGKFGFDTFSYKKSVLERGSWIDPSLRYPPYQQKWKLLDKFLKWL